MPYKVITRIVITVILVMILRDFTANNFLYVYYEILTVHKRASIYFNNILLIVFSTVLWFFIKFMIFNQVYIGYAVGVFAF